MYQELLTLPVFSIRGFRVVCSTIVCHFVYLWPVYGLFIYGQCTVCLFMASVRFVYLWPVYGLFIYGKCTVCLFMASVWFVHRLMASGDPLWHVKTFLNVFRLLSRD